MRTPEFAAYVSPARLYPELWRLGLGLLLILFAYLGFVALIVVAVFGLVGPMAYFGFLQDMMIAAQPGPTLVMFLTFVGMALGAILAAAACHFRGPGSLFGPPGDTLRGFFTVLAIALPFFGAAVAVSVWRSPPVANLPLQDWLWLLPLSLPLLFIQTTAEELVFRGYLQQQLAARFRSRLIWMFLPSAIFASLHWSPQAGSGLWLILTAAFLFALIAADLTEKTGSLGAAMGLHFINNLFAVLILSVDGTITGLSLFITPYQAGDSSGFVLAILLDLFLLLILWRVLRFVLDR